MNVYSQGSHFLVVEDASALEPVPPHAGSHQESRNLEPLLLGDARAQAKSLDAAAHADRGGLDRHVIVDWRNPKQPPVRVKLLDFVLHFLDEGIPLPQHLAACSLLCHHLHHCLNIQLDLM